MPWPPSERRRYLVPYKIKPGKSQRYVSLPPPAFAPSRVVTSLPFRPALVPVLAYGDVDYRSGSALNSSLLTTGTAFNTRFDPDHKRCEVRRQKRAQRYTPDVLNGS